MVIYESGPHLIDAGSTVAFLWHPQWCFCGTHSGFTVAPTVLPDVNPKERILRIFCFFSRFLVLRWDG